MCLFQLDSWLPIVWITPLIWGLLIRKVVGLLGRQAWSGNGLGYLQSSPFTTKRTNFFLITLTFIYIDIQYIEDITRSLRSLVRYCSCHYENIKFMSLSQRVMFSLLYGETNSTKAKGGNRDVIERYDTHKGDIRKIRHSGPGWSCVWNLRVV